MATEKIFIAVEVESGKAVKNLAQIKSEMKALRDSNTKLNKQLKKGEINLDQFGKAASRNDVQLKRLSSQYREATNAASGLTKAGLRFRDKLAGSLTKAMVKVGAAIAAAFAAREIIAFGKHILDVTKTFDKSLKQLSAITGAAGDDLAFLGEKAIELSANSTKSSAEVLEAFQKIASAKPELLESGDALVSLTEKAIILAEASGLDLVTAAEQLGSALNAMKLPAEEAGHVIDVLANASKLGAREIPFLNIALSKFGGVAAQAGVSIEDSAAAIEILGKAIPEASIVGTNFRNVLTILQIEAEKAGREFEGLDAELERLAPDLNSVSKLTKTFGRENLLAVQTLISERDALGELSSKLGETGTALEQARINASSLEGSMERLGNVFDNTLIQIGTQGSGGLTDIFNELATGLAEFTGQTKENTEEINITNKALETSALAWNVLLSAFSRDQNLKGIVDSFKDLFNIQEEAREASRVADAEDKIRLAAAKAAADEIKRLAKEKADSDKKAAERKKKETKDNFVVAGSLDALRKELQQLVSDRNSTVTSDEERIGRINREIDALNKQIVAVESLKEAEEGFSHRKLEILTEEDIAQSIADERKKESSIFGSLLKIEAEDESVEFFKEETKRHNKKRELNDEEIQWELNKKDIILDSAAATAAALSIIFQQNESLSKGFAIASITIDAASAVMQAVDQYGYPQALVPIAAIVAQTAASISQVSSAEQGGVVPGEGGILNGARHSQGGIAINVGGRQVLEAEGGEPILTRGVAQSPSLLAAASRINILGGGKPLAEHGRLIPTRVTPNFDIPLGDTSSTDAMLAIISEIDFQPRVFVEEITTAQNNVAVSERQSTL